MKKRAALAEPATTRAPKRQKTQLAMTQEIVRKELRKNLDYKYTDITGVALNATTTGATYSFLNSLVRGSSGINNFDGNTITPRGVLLKYYMHSSEVRNTMRVMIFQWLESDAAAPATVLQSTAAGLGPVSPVSVTNKPYIKVLYDKAHQIAPTAGGDTTVKGEAVTPVETVYIPGRRLRSVRYQPTSNSIQYGNIVMLVISDDIITPSPQITYYGRVTFTDH